MSIELTEEDIKAIAAGRAKTSKKEVLFLLGFVGAWLTAIIVTESLYPSWTSANPQLGTSDIIGVIGLIIFAGIIAQRTIIWSRKEKAILKWWKY